MEHFTNSITDENEDLSFLSRGHAASDHDLDPTSKDKDDIDIEALLHRPRFGYRRSKPLYEAPEFVQRLEAFIEEDEGSSIVFQCRWKSFPKPNIKWFKDDEEITEDHPYYLIQADDKSGILRLTLHDITQQDEGAYKCKAENQEGVASTTGYLSVRASPVDKTLSSQQKAKNNSSPTSPNVSLAPHLCTILEQKSLEEREAEAQRKLPPSPLQNYIETVQKTKTWPLAKMGYNPEDFIRSLYPENGVSEDNDDAKSSGSDTSIDSQPEEGDIKIPSRGKPHSDSDQTNTKIASHATTGGNYKKTIANSLPVKDNSVDEGSENESESDSDDDKQGPICTVSVQMRSEDSVSRLTKIRQDEKHRLSLTLSEGTGCSDSEDDSLSDETPVINESEITPKVNVNSTVQVQNRYQGEDGIKRMVTLQDNKQHNVDNNKKDDNVEHGNNLQMQEEQPLNESKASTLETTILTQDTNEALSKKLIKQTSDISRKSLIQQKSREKNGKVKKQKSFVELSIDWLFQKITGKVGEQLDLPWIYYFAFTVLGACLAAAIRLNPFYLIVTVAVVSLLSFRFLLYNEVLNAVDSNDGESNEEDDA